MTSASGILEVRDRVFAALEHLADPEAGVVVHKEYAPDWLDVDLWKDNPHLASAYVGRHVFIFAAGKSHQGNASRQLDLNEYRIEVVVLERYDGEEPVPPEEWMSERIAWVEREIYDFFGNTRAYPDRIGNVYPQAQEWTTVYSPDLFREMRLFRSAVAFDFRRLDMRT